MINIFNTYIDPRSSGYIGKVLKSTFVSEGRLVAEFQNKLSTTLGLVNPIAVNSGTSALHLAVDLAGVGRGDEVICPAQTFIASAMAVIYQGAKPVFADIQYQTGNLDPQSVKKNITKKTKAIMVVHWAGYPADLDEIHTIAREHRLVVIEDAAHALGATYQGKPIGSISPFTCFSFQAIKHLTTGDGGALCCLNPGAARRGFATRWFGIDRQEAKSSLLGERVYTLTYPGYKYHLNDYAAALGLANLSGFTKRLKKRRAIAEQYQQALAALSGIRLFCYTTDRESSFWLFGMHVSKRNDFIQAMKDRGIVVSVVHQRIDRHPIFGGRTPGLENQERFDRTQIHIPIHDAITEKEAAYIIQSIQKGW